MTRYADPKYIFEETMKTYDARLVDKLFLTLFGLHLSSVIIMSSMLIMNLHKINNFNIYLTGFVLILFLVEFLIIAKIGVYVCKIFRTEKRARQWIAVPYFAAVVVALSTSTMTSCMRHGVTAVRA